MKSQVLDQMSNTSIKSSNKVSVKYQISIKYET